MEQARSHSALETWAAAVISRARSDAPLEDASVELKASWPDPKRAARQLAGHANASSSGRVRWLIGVGEDGDVPGARRSELSTWWAQVCSHFDGDAPRLSDSIVELAGTPPVTVLDFDVSRRPYVIKIRSGASTREIPWREATGTRSATREEVMSILTPRAELPSAHLLNAALRAEISHHELLWTLQADLYVEADPSTTLVIPERGCRGAVVSDELRITAPLERFSFHMPFGNTHEVQALPNQVAYRAPGSVNVVAGGMSGLPPRPDERPTQEVVLHLELQAAQADRPFRLEEVFVPGRPSDDTWAVWVKPHPGFLSEKR